jgi:hypothetical protein
MPDYGHAHRKARAAAAARVNAEGYVCTRCFQYRQPGTAFELDHDDTDPTTYRGPSCPGCNASAGGAKARRNDRLKRIRTRNW